jgi:ADP-ribose diphosphatase
MSDFDAADCLARYRALIRAQPDQFVNPSGDIYEILLDDQPMERARRDARESRAAAGLPSDDTRVGVLALDPYVTVLREAVRFADDTYGLYNRVLMTSGTAVLPLFGDQIVLLDRFRHGTRRWHLEAPRGTDSTEATRRDDAARELREETGAELIELIELGHLHSSSGCMNEEHQLFLGRVAALGTADRHEAIRSIRLLSTTAVEQLIADGTITDAPTIALFVRARFRGYL